MILVSVEAEFQGCGDKMYMTIKETAAYLSMHESVIENYISAGKIRAVHNGEQYLINGDQFTSHLEQVEKHRKMAAELLSEPLPEDIDVRDED